MKLYRKLIDPKLLMEDLGEEPYVWTETDVEIQEHSDWLRFKEMIERQPTVDAVEVVHGRWEDFCRGKMCCCSACKAEFDNTCNDIHGEWEFCPNCGAKMDGERKDNA